MSKNSLFHVKQPLLILLRIHPEIQKISYYHQINIVSRETMDYKKMNSKRMRKLCKQIRNANTTKKHILIMSIFMNVEDRD